MNKSRFDTIVRNRAYERVNAKIIKFRADIIAAIRELDPSIHPDFNQGRSGADHGWWPQNTKKDSLGTIITNISKGLVFEEKQSVGGDYPRLKWPRRIFDAEEEAVTKELLATMDEMQKALCSPAPDVANAEPEALPEDALTA